MAYSMTDETNELTARGNGASLQNTLPAAAAAGAATSPTNPDAAAQDAINSSYKRLNELLAAVPDVDYAAKYKDILAQTQAQPTYKAPSPLINFAAALGAPQAAPGMIQQNQMREAAEKANKDLEIKTLQQAILQGSIQQEMQKGNFRKALDQSKELESLQVVLKRIEREQELENQIKLETVKATNRATLSAEREKAATERIKILANSRVEVARLSREQRDQFELNARTALGGYLSQKNAAGEPMHTPEEAASLAVDAALRLSAGNPAPASGNTGGGGSGNNPPPANESPISRVIRLSREAAAADSAKGTKK